MHWGEAARNECAERILALVADTSEHATPKPAGRTKRVRIAVAVDRNGFWNCYGCEGSPDDEAMELAVEGVDHGESRHFITADVPLPDDPAEIVGVVE